MELGGNAPFIVFDDADIDAAVEGAMVAKMRHSAETCTAANRFYVEAGAVDEFSEKFTAAMADVKIGNGFDEGVTCGPLINKKAVADVDELVQGAVASGATVLLGGSPSAGQRAASTSPPCSRDVPPDAEIAKQEIFGPVAPIITFTDHDEMIRQANDTELGSHRLRVHARSGQGPARQRADPGRHDRPQPRRRLRSGGPVRRHEAVRPRPRRQHRRHLRVLRDPVHRHELVGSVAASCSRSTPLALGHSAELTC